MNFRIWFPRLLSFYVLWRARRNTGDTSWCVEKAIHGFFNIVVRTPLSRIPRQLSAISQDWHKRSQLTCFAAFRRPVWQRGFQMTPIFYGLQPLKMAVRGCNAQMAVRGCNAQMAVHPRTAHPLLKLRAFQQPATSAGRAALHSHPGFSDSPR